MKTTIDIADELLAEAKAVAERNGETLRSLTEDGLRLAIQRRRSGQKWRAKPVIFRGGKGPAPGLPEDFVENIRDWAYDEEPPR